MLSLVLIHLTSYAVPYGCWLSALVVDRSNPSVFLLGFSLHTYRSTLLAVDAKQSGAGDTLSFGGGVICNWHVLSAGRVLTVAISCVACVWCGSGLDHGARVSGHVVGVWWSSVSHVCDAFNGYIC